MAKQGKALPARRSQETEGSLFLRSAESLGRVIGTLQRQLDSAAKRMTDHVDDAQSVMDAGNGTRPRKAGAKTAGRKTKRTTKSTRTAAATRKTAATGARKTKKAAARKTTRRS